MHLAGNCLIGGLVIHLLCKVLGYGSGWLLLLLAGAGGNLLNVALRQGPHFSVGLSTSVFAAIGILTGLQIVRFRTRSLRECLLPLGAGAGLLAFLGSEGVRTDLGAHLFGFLVGIGCGAVVWPCRHGGENRQASQSVAPPCPDPGDGAAFAG